MTLQYDRQRPLPLIPEDILRAYNVLERGDTRFTAAARLRQALWRESRGYPGGAKRNAHGSVRLGSRLSQEAGASGLNFLTPEIAALVRRELVYREEGALIEAGRLWWNLLSSQALTFNLFALAKLDPETGTRLFRDLFPDFVDRVDAVRFEHSPGRGDARFTGDKTAFDVFAEVQTTAGRRGFVAIEVKYAEGAGAGGPYADGFDRMSEAFGLFRDDATQVLRKAPLQQFWREHLLAEATMRERGEYQDYRFAVLYPTENRHCRENVERFAEHLADKRRFQAVALERCAKALSEISPEVGRAFTDRYLDLSPVHDIVEQALAEPLPVFRGAA